MRALVIEHDHVSPLGPIGERLEERGYELTLHRVVPADRHRSPAVETDFPRFVDHDLVVVLGAPWSTFDEVLRDAWIDDELDQLREADEAGVPVLGICFGGQLLATVHGGSVAPSEQPEIGWTEVEADDVVPAGPWFQWHYDRWQLPPDAEELARNAAASQAFRLRRNLAVQFHPELTSAGLLGWLGNGGTEAAQEFGLDTDQMVSDTRALDAANRDRAHQLVDNFLDRVATDAPGTA